MKSFWSDSVAIARKAWPDLRGNGGHGLGNLKKVLGLNFRHHDAGEDARAVFVENLRWAAAFAPKQKLTIEPINGVDMPRYFLNDFDLAMDVLAEIDAPNLFLQFDAYHAAKIMGDVLGTWDKVRARTAHIQVGGVPDRAEPTGG